MNYLDLFPLRNESTFKEDIKGFEVKTNITFPPVFRTFSEIYNISEPMFSRLCFLNSKNNLSTFLFSRFLLDEDNVSFYNFFYLNDIIENMQKVYLPDDEIWSMEVIAIAECAFQGYLLLGIGKQNQDKIYIEFASSENRISYLCDNIFEFFKNYAIEPDESSLPERKTVNDLYKNWNEDFWRVREDEKPS